MRVKKAEREPRRTRDLIELGESRTMTPRSRKGEAGLKKLAEEARRQEVEALLSGEADAKRTPSSRSMPVRGTESQDWAEMLCHAAADRSE